MVIYGEKVPRIPWWMERGEVLTERLRRQRMQQNHRGRMNQWRTAVNWKEVANKVERVRQHGDDRENIKITEWRMGHIGNARDVRVCEHGAAMLACYIDAVWTYIRYDGGIDDKENGAVGCGIQGLLRSCWVVYGKWTARKWCAYMDSTWMPLNDDNVTKVKGQRRWWLMAMIDCSLKEFKLKLKEV